MNSLTKILIVFVLLLANGVFAMQVDEFKTRFATGPLAREESEKFETLGGFLVDRLGHIPSPGENFVRNGWRFEIADMDRHRVDKVLVGKVGATPPAKGTT